MEPMGTVSAGEASCPFQCLIFLRWDVFGGRLEVLVLTPGTLKPHPRAEIPKVWVLNP